MAHDSPRELQDLTTVNHFYLGLLEKTLGHGVPIPWRSKMPVHQKPLGIP